MNEVTFKDSKVNNLAILIFAFSISAMLYFNLYPDFRIVKKYIVMDESIELLCQQSLNGYPIVVDWYDTESRVHQINTGFDEVIGKYELVKHRNNLLFIALKTLIYHETLITTFKNQWSHEERLRQLSTWLVAMQTGPKKLTVKTSKGLSESIEDEDLIKWISALVAKQIEKGRVPFELTGLLLDKLSIETASTLKPIKVKVKLKRLNTKLTAEFGLHVWHYLNEETYLTRPKGVEFTNEQMDIVYRLMVLFGLTNEREFGSARSVKDKEYQPDNYVRSLLATYKKTYLLKEKEIK